MAEALERVGEEYPKRVVIAPNGRSEVKRNPFLDVEGLYRALLFLATTYWDARSGKRPCQDLGEAARVQSGFSYAGGQSPTTVGRYRDYYETTYRGRTLQLGEHLGRGSSKDPRHTIRVGLAWDAEGQVVVIGYVGQHQRTRAT